MKIRRVTLRNFKNFSGEHELDLTSGEGARNVVLIGGVNGAGKTTFVEAIRLCLFGTRQGSGLVSDSDYTEYIKQSLNREAARKGENENSVQLDVTVDDSVPAFDLGIKRTWRHGPDGRFSMSLSITRDGRPFEVVPQEYWEDYLAGLAPAYLSGYVFFDGELVNELATGPRADQMLRQSARDVIGLNLCEKLRQDLGLMVERIRRRNVHEGSTQREISDKLQVVSELERRIDAKKTALRTNAANMEKLVAAAREADDELRRVTGQYAKSHQQNHTETLKMGSELATLDAEVVTACGEVLPFAIPAELCARVRKQLRIEQGLRRVAAGRELLDEVKQRLEKRLRPSGPHAPVGHKLWEVVGRSIEDVFADLEHEATEGSGAQVLHDLPVADAGRVASALEDPRRGLARRLAGLLKKREALLASAKSLGKRVKAGPDESSMREFISDAAEVRSESTRMAQLNEGLVSEIAQLTTEVDSFRVSIAKLEEKVVCAKDDQEKIDLAIRTTRALDAYMKTVEEAKRDELQEAVSMMYMQLANKDDMVGSVKVDSASFSVKLFDRQGVELDRRRISAGEKQVYALAVLWGLSRISSKRLPLVVDSPLAKLDGTHVRNIVGKFFPNAAEQVIILSHDREVDDELYERLKPHVCREYTFEIKGDRKIVEGYFRV
jgi:DNA sulfur modification protein DndD